MQAESIHEPAVDSPTAAIESSLSLRRWGYFLAAAVLTVVTTPIVLKLVAGPQVYSELIVGSIAWRLKAKTPDYLLLLSLVTCFFAWLSLITQFADKLRRALPLREQDFHDTLLLLCTPAGLWMAALLTTKSSSLDLLKVSGVLLLFGLGQAFLLSRKGEAFWNQVSETFSGVLRRLLLAICVAPLAIAAVAAGGVRLSPLLGLTFGFRTRAVEVAALAALLIATAVVVILLQHARTASELQHRLAVHVFVLQMLLPAALLLVIPLPWLAGGRSISGYQLTPWAWAFAGMCVAGAWLELWRKRTLLSAGAAQGPSDLITVSSVVAMVFLFKAQFVGVPMLGGDDYHDGELLVPWWSLTQFHLLPFWDYAPARGLVNYAWGAALAVFLDGKASSLVAMWPFVHLAMLFVAAFVLSRVLGTAVAALALFLFPYVNGLSEIDVGVTVFIYLLATGFLRWAPVRWLGAWVGFGTLLVLWAPGQGGLAILATAPLGLWMAHRAWSQERGRLRVLSLIVAAVAIVLLLTPLGRVLLAALRYGAEQSGVNSIAHGINWSESFGRADANPWLYELMRTSWVFVAVWAGVLLLRWKWGGDRSRGLAIFAYATPLLILSVVYIFRAAGRIDWVGPSRLGVASGWILSLLLPLLVFAVREHRNPGTRTLVWATLVGLVIPAFGGAPTRFASSFEPMADPRSSPKYLQPISSVPGLGSGLLNEEHAKRLVALKKVLDTVLDGEETYLDASGRHATYFYFGRRPPIESGSVYNLVTEKQQLRAAEALRSVRPPLVLVGADNIVHDGGPSSLRSNILFRHLATEGSYKVAKIGGHVWLISPAKVPRLSGLEVQWLSDIDDQPGNPFVQIFTQGNLEFVPASWGRSFASLEKHLRPVTEIKPEQRISQHAVEYTQAGEFVVHGADPHVTFALSNLNLDGQDAGVLAFDFSCKAAGPTPVLEIYWSSEGKPESESAVARLNAVNGRLLLPLDAYPTWLLAKRMRTLRIDVQAKESCSSFRIDNVRLYQRRAADALREGLRGASPASAVRAVTG
jgi:hypothetical protein